MTDRVLVTGAGGFIGSHLVEALVRAGAAVRALVHYNSAGRRGHLDDLPTDVHAAVEVVPADVSDAGSVRRAVHGCRRVFHLAALIGIPYSYRAPESYVRVNVDGMLAVLEACRAEGVERLVHTSTSEVYGSPESVPIAETHRLRPQSPYAATKSAADMLAVAYHASFGLPVTVVRPFNTYGPRQSARAVIPTVIVQALRGDAVVLGATETVRDFLFVDDTVRGFLAAAERGAPGEILNLGTGTGTPIAAVVEHVGTILGRRLHVTADPARLRPAASEVDRLVCDASRARGSLHWTPTVDLATGLARTVAWIRDHAAHYRPEEYAV